MAWIFASVVLYLAVASGEFRRVLLWASGIAITILIISTF